MGQSTVDKAYDSTVNAGGVVTGDVTTEGATKIGILSVMDNAASAGDIGTVVLRTYDGDRPQQLVANIPLNSTYTLGPTLVGAVTQKLVVFDVAPFVECQYDITNTAAASRNLKVFVYTYKS